MQAAKKLALFHHSPDATDDMIDEVVERTSARTAVPVLAAAEGSYIDIWMRRRRASKEPEPDCRIAARG